MSESADIRISLEFIPESLRAQIQIAWEQYCEQAAQRGHQIPTDLEFLNTLSKVWANSRFISNSCIRNPEIISEVINSAIQQYTPSFPRSSVVTQSGTLERSRLGYHGDRGNQESSANIRDYKQLSEFLTALEIEDELMNQLRQFRTRELVRIAWCDIAGWVSLDETLLNLSALAETCLQLALDFVYQQACAVQGFPIKQDGTPQQLVVLAMGKLGAWELNFSSDIDLIFAYPEEGVFSNRKQTSYSEFYTRLCRHLVKVIDATTENGFVYRVDTRLRPFGASGPLAMSFDGMETYYQSQAREWERYAMIKARPVAGDLQAGEQLIKLLRPFVYRRYLDYGAFGALRDLKAKITAELQKKDRLQNVKLGPGGIREIEFIGQAFQLIHGGKNPQLQERRIQQVLKILGETSLLPRATMEKLIHAYRYLRTVENRLQQMDDRQTHDLPAQTVDQQRLAFAMGTTSWEAFECELNTIRDFVHSVFEQVFELPSAERQVDDLATRVWLCEDLDLCVQMLSALGYQESTQAYDCLQAFRESRTVRLLSRKTRETLNQLMPLLLGAVKATENPELTLKRILNCIEAIASRHVYLLLLVENPLALSQLVKLVAASAWISNNIAQHPVLLDDLLDPRSLYAPLNQEALTVALQEKLERFDGNDLEQVMIALRQFKDTQVLKVAAADIMGAIPVLVVSDYLTYIAEVILSYAVEYAWHLTLSRYGVPVGVSVQAVNGFAVIAYGKMGGVEMGYRSDLDLVFLYQCENPNALTEGVKPVTESEFYIRMGKRVMNLLNTQMMSGMLYEVDMRLRPSGNSGLLVTQVDAYQRYQQQDAWTWEHQALVRGRFIAGDQNLAGQFNDIRAQVLTLHRDPCELREDVCEMREKMRVALLTDQSGEFHLKQGKGGMTDIEFIVQYCVLAHAEDYPELCDYTDNVCLLELIKEKQLLTESDVSVLQRAYQIYRNEGHRRALQALSVSVEVDLFATEREKVWQIWQKLMS